MKQDSGNVLFLILIAVVLFAALSYAISSSTRQTGGGPTAEKARSYASAIISQGATLRQAITRVRISNNCTEGMINFVNPVYKKYDATVINANNSTSPADQSCNIFSAAGGNVTTMLPPAEALTPPTNPASYTGYGQPGHGGARTAIITGLGTDGAAGTASANDLQWNINFISRDVCKAINEFGNVTNPAGEPPVDVLTGTVGTYTNGSFAGTAVINDANVNGHLFFCYYISASNVYQFMYVLMER